MCVQVCVWEEVRCVESQEYRELQRLCEESERRLKQVSESPRVTLIYKMLALT